MDRRQKNFFATCLIPTYGVEYKTYIFVVSGKVSLLCNAKGTSHEDTAVLTLTLLS